MNEVEAVDLDRIVVDVFETMLADEVVPMSIPRAADRDLITASVHFAGPNPGSLVIECSEQAACSVAELLTGVHHDAVSEDVLDGLAEMANMVGGNLKSLLHAGAGLSVPLVRQGGDRSQPTKTGREATPHGFACGEALFWVTYLDERPGGAPP